MQKIFVGLSIIADCIDFRKPEVAALTLTGHFDSEILQALFYTAHHKQAVGNEHMSDPVAQSNLANLKDRIRETINYIFREAEREAQGVREFVKEKVVQELAQSNKPHHLGTVAEIAARHGISKSEVRRRKADGTLDSYLDRLCNKD